MNDVISATGGGSITAGTGIQIVDGVISQTNTRFQMRNTVTANFFTNIKNKLINTTPFVLSLWDADGTVSQLGLLTFTGAMSPLGNFGIGMLVYNNNIYIIYDVDGLGPSSDDTITVYGYNMTLSGMETVTLSKNTLIS